MSTADAFSDDGVTSYSQLLFDIARKQVVVGARYVLNLLISFYCSYIIPVHEPTDPDWVRCWRFFTPAHVIAKIVYLMISFTIHVFLRETLWSINRIRNPLFSRKIVNFGLSLGVSDGRPTNTAGAVSIGVTKGYREILLLYIYIIQVLTIMIRFYSYLWLVMYSVIVW